MTFKPRNIRPENLIFIPGTQEPKNFSQRS